MEKEKTKRKRKKVVVAEPKQRGGKRAGAGKPKIDGLKRRSTTATDAEWVAMKEAQRNVRVRIA